MVDLWPFEISDAKCTGHKIYQTEAAIASLTRLTTYVHVRWYTEADSFRAHELRDTHEPAYSFTSSYVEVEPELGTRGKERQSIRD